MYYLLAAPVAVFTLKSSKVFAYASSCLNLSIIGDDIVDQSIVLLQSLLKLQVSTLKPARCIIELL